MIPTGGYIESLIVTVLAFVLSLFVHRITKKRWLGCLMQFLAFIVIFCLLVPVSHVVMDFVSSSHKDGAMIGVRYTEQDRNCKIQNEWWIKPDGTYYYECDKGITDNPETVAPCDIELWGDKGTFTRIDSIHGVSININPQFVIYFNLDKQKATPVWGEDTLEVVSTDWELVKEYFKNH